MNTTASVRVLDAGELLEERICRTVRLRDGRRAAMWRGLAYALDADESINVSVAGVPRAECLPDTGPTTSDSAPSRWDFVEGIDDAWLLLAGDVASRDMVAANLRRAGFAVLRTGAWLGEPAPTLDPDWFVRFARPASGEDLRTSLERVLGPASATPGGMAEPQAGDLRYRLIASELVKARAEAAGLAAELQGQAADMATLVARVASLQADLDRALAELEAADAVASAAPVPIQAPTPAPPAASQRLARKLQDEVESVLTSFLPGVQLLRNSLTVICAEYRDRGGVYRALNELAQGAARLPSSWKKVRGAEGWWERHVSTGEDDSGRAYARYGASGSIWEVLLSHKGEQPRDINWLHRHS